MEEMRLQDVSYNGAPGRSHYLAQQSSTASRIDALYADPRWVRVLTAEYLVGPEGMGDKKGHCPMMVTLEVKVGEPVDNGQEEQESDEEGVGWSTPVKWREEDHNDKWQQWVQQRHVEMRWGSHAHRAMGKAANVCRFGRLVGRHKPSPNYQELVVKPEERQQEEVVVRAKAQVTAWEGGVAQSKKGVKAAQRAVEHEHGRIYGEVVAVYERHKQRAVPYKSLRYIRELAQAGQLQEIRAVRLQNGRGTRNKREVLAAVAESFRGQENQGQQQLSETTQRIIQALLRVFTVEQREAIHCRRVTLREITEAVHAHKGRKSLGLDQLVAEAYQNLRAPELDGLAPRSTKVLRTGKPPAEWRGKVRPLYRKGDHLRPGNWRPRCCAVTEAKLELMVVFGRIQRRLYAAGAVLDNMWESLPGSSTQEASFLCGMSLDIEDLEAFMASLDVKAAFLNTPHRVIEEVWRQLQLPYGDFGSVYLRKRRYTIAAGKGCT